MTRRTVARLYKKVSTAARDGGYVVLLDGKPLQIPGRATVVLPSETLAEAIADEWRGQKERVDPATMPLTSLAYAALDAVPRHRGQVVDHILGFGRSDLLCYRADGPPELTDRQREAWDPLLAWIANSHGVRLQVGIGAAYIDQSEGALLALEKLVCSLGDFQLAGVDRAAALTGSLVMALALLEERLDARVAFVTAHIDELYQAEKWGRDPEAESRRARILTELDAAGRFMKLAKGPQA